MTHRKDDDDYIVLPTGTRVRGLTPEWIRSARQYMVVEYCAQKASEDGSVSYSEARAQLEEQYPIEKVKICMDKYNKFMEEGRARRAIEQ